MTGREGGSETGRDGGGGDRLRRRGKTYGELRETDTQTYGKQRETDTWRTERDIHTEN